MPVKETELTTEQKQSEADSQEKRESAFVQELIKTVDLPAGLSSEIDSAIEKEEASETKESADEPEASAESDTEQVAEESTEDEELIPKSKVNKRFDELTRNSKMQQAEINRLKAEAQKSVVKTDPEREKLEAMSQDELRTLRKQIRLAQIKNSADDNKVAELMELEDKVDSVMQSSPQRFQTAQVSKFYDAVNSTDIENFDEAKPELFNYAKSIFGQSPELQSSVTGQATAWNLAVEHYKQLSKLTAGKSQKIELERKVNTLKKKTALDTSIQKGNTKSSDESRLFNKAKSGTLDDKMDFIKKRLNTDSYIPEEFRV